MKNMQNNFPVLHLSGTLVERLDKDSHQCTTALYSCHKKPLPQPLGREKALHGWAEGVGIKMVVLMPKPPYN